MLAKRPLLLLRPLARRLARYEGCENAEFAIAGGRLPYNHTGTAKRKESARTLCCQANVTNYEARTPSKRGRTKAKRDQGVAPTKPDGGNALNIVGSFLPRTGVASATYDRHPERQNAASALMERKTQLRSQYSTQRYGARDGSGMIQRTRLLTDQTAANP